MSFSYMMINLLVPYKSSQHLNRLPGDKKQTHTHRQTQINGTKLKRQKTAGKQKKEEHRRKES